MQFVFSKHFKKDKDIESSLAIDCVQTGKRSIEAKSKKYKTIKKYRKGDLVVIYKKREGYCFVITAYWNVRGVKK